ncbi:MAG: guanylate kinase, partial [Candidatus Pacebacteria bacterium]|nr:guanylate kinase [Candidatus Paceibacterota bacterium]
YVSSGQGVLLDIDVQGARQIRSRIIDTSLGYATEFVFIGPPSYSEMERRLRSRGTDREDVIERRLKNAYNELDAWNEYDFLVINEDVQTAAEQLQAILKATTCTTSRILGNPWPDLERAL